MTSQIMLATTAIHDADRRFRNRYLRWMAIHAAQLWLVVLIFVIANTSMAGLELSATNTLVIANILTAFFVVSGSLIAWISVHNWLARLYNRIRSRTMIAAERLGRDDQELMLDGAREVIFEWRYIYDVMLLKLFAAAALAVVTVAGQAFAFMLTPTVASYVAGFYPTGDSSQIWLVVALIVLTSAHSISGLFLAVSVYRSMCFSGDGFDPTDALQSRLGNLLAEVKDLRRLGVRPTAA